MLVFKRAISLFLSLALVFAPSLAFGENGTKSHKFEAQDHKAFEKAWHSRAKASRKPASVKASASNFANSSKGPFKSQQAAIESVFKSLNIKGEHFTYTQIPGAKGTARAQILRSKDLESIFVDEYSTGTASRWEIKKGDTTIVADRPYEGHFSHIEITQPRAKAIMKVDLQLNPDLKTYRLAGVKIEAPRVDHESIAMCASDLSESSKTSVANMTKFIEQLQAVSSGASPEAALTCRLTHNQKMIFDKSCYEGEFASSTDDMARALAKVFGTRGTASPPRMLQCVEQLGFANQSAKMQADFMGMQEAVGYELMINGAWEQSQVDRDTDCKMQTSIPIWSGSQWSENRVDIDKFTVSFPKMIKCDASLPANEAGRLVDGTVVIGKPSAWMAQRRGGGDAVAGYAALFLHEMMHKTGLPEEQYENLIANVQQCCADPGIRTQSEFDSNPACKAASQTAREQMDQQANATEMRMYFPGYSQIYDNVQNRLQQSSRNPSVNRFMTDWYEAIQADPKERERLAKLIQCEKENPTNTGPCIDAAFDGFKDFNNRYMNNQCRAGVRSGLYTGINCDDIKNIFKVAMQNAKGNPSVILDPAVIRSTGVSRQVSDETRIAPVILDTETLVPPIDTAEISRQLQLVVPQIPTITVADNGGRQTTQRTGGLATTTEVRRQQLTNPTTGSTTGTTTGTTTGQRQLVAVLDPVTRRPLPSPTDTAGANRLEQLRQQGIREGIYGNDVPDASVNRALDQQARTSRTSTNPTTTGRVVTNPTTRNQPQNPQQPSNQPVTLGGTTTNQPQNPQQPLTLGGTTTNLPQNPQQPDQTLPPSDTNTPQNPTDGNQAGSTDQPTLSPGSGSTTGVRTVAPAARTQTTGVRMASNTNILSNGTAAPVVNGGYTPGAAPLSSGAAATLASASSAIATNLSDYAGRIADRIGSTVPQAYAKAIAPAPTASRGFDRAGRGGSRYAQASSGGRGGLSRLMPGRRLASTTDPSSDGGGSGDQQGAKVAKPEAASVAPGDDDDIIDPSVKPLSRRQIEAQAAADTAAFESRPLKQSNDVVIALVNLTPSTMSLALEEPNKSRIIQRLRGMGWVTIPIGKTNVIKSPQGRCYSADPRKVIVPMARCPGQ